MAFVRAPVAVPFFAQSLLFFSGLRATPALVNKTIIKEESFTS